MVVWAIYLLQGLLYHNASVFYTPKKSAESPPSFWAPHQENREASCKTTEKKDDGQTVRGQAAGAEEAAPCRSITPPARAPCRFAAEIGEC